LRACGVEEIYLLALQKGSSNLTGSLRLEDLSDFGAIRYEERKKGSTLGRPFSTVELLVEFDSAKFGLKKFRAD
jgi:hypothetical protein